MKRVAAPSVAWSRRRRKVVLVDVTPADPTTACGMEQVGMGAAAVSALADVIPLYRKLKVRPAEAARGPKRKPARRRRSLPEQYSVEVVPCHLDRAVSVAVLDWMSERIAG